MNWHEQRSPAAGKYPFGFSTKYTDEETGLVYYGYRYYNPTVGRWISRDPIEKAGGSDLFLFLGNDAQNLVDVKRDEPFSQRANSSEGAPRVTQPWEAEAPYMDLEINKTQTFPTSVHKHS